MVKQTGQMMGYTKNKREGEMTVRGEWNWRQEKQFQITVQYCFNTLPYLVLEKCGILHQIILKKKISIQLHMFAATLIG